MLTLVLGGMSLRRGRTGASMERPGVSRLRFARVTTVEAFKYDDWRITNLQTYPCQN